MKKLIILLLMAITAMPMLGQCDLELKEMVKNLKPKGIFLQEGFFDKEKDPNRSPDKADFSIVLNKGTTYEYFVVCSDKFPGKTEAQLINVEINEKTQARKIKHVLFDMKPEYFVNGVMRATFTVPEVGIYYLMLPLIDDNKACGYFRLDFIKSNRN